MTEDKIETLAANMKEYLGIQYNIVKLQLTEKISLTGSFLVSRIVILLIVFLSVIFLSLGGGFYISTLLGSHIAGFLIIGAFYLVASIILMVFRKRLLGDPVRDRIIYNLLNKNLN